MLIIRMKSRYQNMLQPLDMFPSYFDSKEILHVSFDLHESILSNQNPCNVLLLTSVQFPLKYHKHCYGGWTDSP